MAGESGKVKCATVGSATRPAAGLGEPLGLTWSEESACDTLRVRAGIESSRMTPANQPFEQLAPHIIQELRSALSALIEASSHISPIRKATDLERALQLPTTLAWKIYTVAQADAPLAKVGNIPGPAAMARLFNAAIGRGVPASAVENARTAFAAFENLVKVHAGTRAALDSMISGLKIEGSDQIDLHHKRAAFHANSHIWGVQARTQLSCFILRASPLNSARLDVIGLRGLVNLRRLRKDVSWVVSSMRISDDGAGQHKPPAMMPVDPTVEGSEVPLLRNFCSQPLPLFRTVRTDSGTVNTLLEPTSVGTQSSVTCLLGDSATEVMARFRDGNDREQGTLSFIRTPSEVLIHDVLAAPGTFADRPPRVTIYGDHRGIEPSMTNREGEGLALRETVTHLGRGISVLHTPDVPRYSDMVRHAFERKGWDPETFEVYRCRVEYPVMPSSVAVSFDLLDSPR